jgi:hypothetical protein
MVPFLSQLLGRQLVPLDSNTKYNYMRQRLPKIKSTMLEKNCPLGEKQGLKGDA